MADETDLGWLLELHEEHGARLHRLAVMLGAGESADQCVRSALLALQRRENRIVDPLERLEYLEEHIIHETRALGRPLEIPAGNDAQEVILEALRSKPRTHGEILTASHYLSRFGPELSRLMRLSVRSSNQRLEVALQRLNDKLGRGGIADAVSAELAEALQAVARQIRVPSDEDLEEDLASRALVRRPGRVRAQTVVISVVAALLIGAAAAVASRSVDMVGGGPASESPHPAPSPTAPVALSAVVRQVPIYYLGRDDHYLYRELRNLPASSNLARMGIEAIMTLPPLDPDYSSLWVGAVREVTLEGDQLTVDLSAESYNIGPAFTQQAIDQMVYTASEAMGNPDLKVRFLADGATPPAAFAGDGYGRHGLEPMPGVWINSPRNQDRANPGEVLITGVLKPGHNAPVIVITETGSGSVVEQTVAQTTLTENSEGWHAWSVSVELAQVGSYQVKASATAPEGTTFEDKIINIG